MARIRTLKPEIHQDEAVGELSDAAFRLYVGLITQADDLGRTKGDPRLLGAQVWPYQPKTAEQIREWLAELDRAELIRRYDHAGRPFVQIDQDRARQAGVQPIRGAISVALRTAVIERDRGRCGICGRLIEDQAQLHIDHIVPVSSGGLTVFDNLQVAHAACNLAKGGGQ